MDHKDELIMSEPQLRLLLANYDEPQLRLLLMTNRSLAIVLLS